MERPEASASGGSPFFNTDGQASVRLFDSQLSPGYFLATRGESGFENPTGKTSVDLTRVPEAPDVSPFNFLLSPLSRSAGWQYHVSGMVDGPRSCPPVKVLGIVRKFLLRAAGGASALRLVA